MSNSKRKTTNRMAKITTIIDIGSNSMRMVVFKKTSHFAFHLINETKSKVKISENSYQNDGYLQEIPMDRAFYALESFLSISKNLKSRKILCVATSALRDAPNKNIFLSRVRQKLGIDIKVINGEREALYGAIAASNLLKDTDFTTIDIGGGSTELALVVDKNITKTFSLNIGTVRLKELFFDKNDLDGAKKYIIDQLVILPQEYRSINKAVGLGGTARALSRALIEVSEYPLDVLHGFSYETKQTLEIFHRIINAKSTNTLLELGIRSDRFDTIKVGTFILKTIVEYLGISTIVTSGVGVREGVYLADILRNSNQKFPSNFQVSVRSLLDRFTDNPKQTAYLGNNIGKLFDTLSPLHTLEDRLKKILIIAAKLQQIGISLNFYKNGEHSSNFILHGLNYGFSHQERILIAMILKYSGKRFPTQKELRAYKDLLPSCEVLEWLIFIHNLNTVLNREFACYPFEYLLLDKKLTIGSTFVHYILQKDLLEISKPIEMEIELRLLEEK